MASPTDFSLKAEYLSADLLEVCVRRIVSELDGLGGLRANLRASAALAEHLLNSMYVDLRSYVLAGCKQEVRTSVEVPATWWQHLKEERFPVWLLRRFPVRYSERSGKRAYYWARVCPHVNERYDDRTGTVHFAFLKQPLERQTGGTEMETIDVRRPKGTEFALECPGCGLVRRMPKSLVLRGLRCAKCDVPLAVLNESEEGRAP